MLKSQQTPAPLPAQKAVRPVNLLGNSPLANVGLCISALERAVNRPAHLPGIVAFSGPSGYGKSTAASVAAHLFGAVFVQARSTWTRKAAHLAILKEMGVAPAATLYGMAEQVAERLAASNAPLVIDECDYLIANNSIELVRDLYESSRAAILLIGEEALPQRLRRFERFHGRVLDFVQAEGATLADARALCALYVADLAIADDLLEKVHKESRGSVRRICVNLERIREEAADNGLAAMDLAAWGKRPLFTGDAPARRLS